jgi:hypothetical protein
MSKEKELGAKTIKKLYRKPQLIRYGALQQITKGGTGSTMEDGNKSSNKRP